MARKPLVGILAAAALLVVILFISGFWSVQVDGPELPDVDVTATGGDLPSVDVDAKEIVVGTSPANVMVPDVDMEPREVEVPTVGVANQTD